MTACAALSYYLIERPLRHRMWAKTDGRTIQIGFGAAAIGGGFLYVLSSPLGGLLYTGENRWGHRTERSWSSDTPYQSRICHMSPSQTIDSFPKACRLIGAGPTIYFVGNSHTDHLRELHLYIHRRFGVTIEGVSQSSCKFPSNPKRKGECSTLQSNLLARIEERAKSGDVVVVSNRFKIPDWWRTPIVDKWLAQSEVVGTINKLAETLSSRGAHVVLMMPTPEFRFDVHLCSTMVSAQEFNRCSISLRPLRRVAHR